LASFDAAQASAWPTRFRPQSWAIPEQHPGSHNLINSLDDIQTHRLEFEVT